MNLAREPWERVYWAVVAVWWVLHFINLSNLTEPQRFGYILGQTVIGALILWGIIKLATKAARAALKGLRGAK